MAGWKIEVTGLRQVMDALKQADAKAQKAIEKQIKDLASEVAAKAAGFIDGQPLSNWGSWTRLQARRARGGGGVLESRDLSFDVGAARSGFKPKRNTFRRRGVSAGYAMDVEQTDLAGAIFEIVGSGSRVETASGRNMVDVINRRYGAFRPRALVKGYYAADVEAKADEIRDRIADELIRLGLTDGA